MRPYLSNEKIQSYKTKADTWASSRVCMTSQKDSETYFYKKGQNKPNFYLPEIASDRSMAPSDSTWTKDTTKQIEIWNPEDSANSQFLEKLERIWISTDIKLDQDGHLRKTAYFGS